MVEYDSAVAYQKVRKRGRRPAADVGRKFTLMSADYEVARVSFDPTREFSFEIAEVLDTQRMPFGTCSSSSPTVNKRELNAWWGHRSVPDVRPGLISRYRELGDCQWHRGSGSVPGPITFGLLLAAADRLHRT